MGRIFGRRDESPMETQPPPYDKDGPRFSPSGASPAASRASLNTLPEVIENLGTGMYQVRTSLLAGPVWFADGAELILISSVSEVVSREWDFNASQRGMVVTFVYLGVLVGNILSGPFGDSFGRRLPILLSFLFIFVFSLCSAFSWGFWSLSFFRFCVGVSIGIGQPAQQALVSEVTPTKWRIIFTSIGQYLFSFGEVYSGFLVMADDPYMKDIHWRVLLIAGAVPSVIFGLAAFAFLKQSPLYLACGGRYEETQEILESMRDDNSSPAVSIDFRPHRVMCGGGGAQTNFGRLLRVVFGPDYADTTCVLMSSCFVVNLAFYGSLYAFPNVMAGGVEIGSNPAMGLVLGGLMEMVGLTAGILCILYFPRITVMRIYVLFMGSALAAFAVGAPRQSTALMKFLTLYGYYGTKFFSVIGFLVFYLYASEVYPTTVRTTGTSVVFAGGRLAAMLASLFYEWVTAACGNWAVFFYLMAVTCAANFVLTMLLTIETFGQVLNDDEDEEEAEDACMEDAVGAKAFAYGSAEELADYGRKR